MPIISPGRGAHATARRGEPWRGHDLAAREPAGGRHPLQRRRQLRRLAPPLLPLPPAGQPHRADLGSMGYGLPAAVAMQRLDPERTVVALARARRRRLPDERPGVRHRRAVRLADRRRGLDNGMYGTIRMHQEREFPGRVSATDLSTPTSPPTPAPSAASARRSTTTRCFAAALCGAGLGPARDRPREVRPRRRSAGTTLVAASGSARWLAGEGFTAPAWAKSR